MKTIFIHIFFIFFTIPILFSQTSSENKSSGDDDVEELLPFQNIIPPGPNAASLGKYGETPVSLFNGKPNISIPLWEIKTKSVTVPISLSYDAGGVKVAEIPSWVGAGWSLSAGGVITRTVRGKPDDSYGYTFNGYMFTNTILQSDDFGNNDEDKLKVRKILQGQYHDYQFDDFYYNFAGYSGKFHVKPGQNPSWEWQLLDVITVPFKKMKFEYILDNDNYRIKKIRVTTPDGIKYIFAQPELTTTITDNTSDFNAVSSWYLTEIKGLNNDVVKFEYEYDYMKRHLITGTVIQENLIYCNAHDVGNYTYCTNSQATITTKSPRLSKIISPDEIIIFEENDSRRDDIYNLKPYGSSCSEDCYSYALKEIKIYKRNGTETDIIPENYLKSFVFYSGNLIGGASGRLTLNAVQEISGDSIKPPYQFEYYNYNDFPSLNSNMNQDYWGYYKANEPTGGTSSDRNRMPKIDFMNGNSHIYKNKFGSNKLVDPASIKNGILTTIKYPTGGYTEFEYGLNFVDNFAYTMGGISIQGESQTHQGTAFSLSATNETKSETFDVPSGFYKVNYSFGGGGNGNGNGDDSKQSINGTFSVIIDGNEVIIEYSSINTNDLPPNGHKIIELTGNGSGTKNNHVVEVKSTSSSVTVSASMSYTYTTDGPTSVYSATIADDKAGGLRVEKITDFSSDNEAVLTRKFSYSGGKIFAIPVWFYKYERMLYSNEMPTYQTCDFLKIHSNNQAMSGIIQGSPVGYSTVTEEKISDNEVLKTVKYFENITGVEYDKFPFFPISQKNMSLIGKLNKEEFYSSVNVVKDITYNYGSSYKDEMHGLVAGEVVGVANASDYQTFNIGHLFKLKDYYARSYTDNLLSKETIEYLNNKEFKTTVNYDYNDYNFISKIILNQEYSNQKTIIEKWYPFNSEEAVIPNGMTDAMILSPVTEQKVTKNSVLTDWQVVDYKKHLNKFYVPDIIRKLDVNSGNLYTHSLFTEYDYCGNIIQLKKKDDIEKTILWGYNYTKPIAKIENKTYDEVMSALSVTYEDLQTKTSSELMIVFESLRNHQNMKDAIITTYTYAPLIGMTSQTDPNGKTIYYKYDDFGRLETIRDQDGKVIKQIEYHYKDENLTKNDKK